METREKGGRTERGGMTDNTPDGSSTWQSGRGRRTVWDGSPSGGFRVTVKTRLRIPYRGGSEGRDGVNVQDGSNEGSKSAMGVGPVRWWEAGGRVVAMVEHSM